VGESRHLGRSLRVAVCRNHGGAEASEAIHRVGCHSLAIAGPLKALLENLQVSGSLRLFQSGLPKPGVGTGLRCHPRNAHRHVFVERTPVAQHVGWLETLHGLAPAVVALPIPGPSLALAGVAVGAVLADVAATLAPMLAVVALLDPAELPVSWSDGCPCLTWGSVQASAAVERGAVAEGLANGQSTAPVQTATLVVAKQLTAISLFRCRLE